MMAGAVWIDGQKEESPADDHGEHEQKDRSDGPAHMRAMFPEVWSFVQFRIPDLIRVEVVTLTCTRALPRRRRYRAGTVASVRIPPDPQRHDGREGCARRRRSPSPAGMLMQRRLRSSARTSTTPLDWTAVNAHSDLQTRMLFKRATDLKGTLRRSSGLL